LTLARSIARNGEFSDRAVGSSRGGGRRPRDAGSDTLKVRRQPRQLRSQITVTAILDATARVLLERGYASATTNLVAEVAGVGIGSLYEYFPNKEALVAALVRREVDGFVAALEREMSTSLDRPFPDALRGALAAALDELEARRDLVRLLVVEYPYVGQLSVIGRLPRRIAELAAFCLRRWGDELSFGDHPANYYVLANMLGGVYLSQTLAPVAQVPREAMLDALTAMLLRILEPRTNPAQSPGGPSTVKPVKWIGVRSG
jgi:AcrR family transcriptional regulator